MMSFEEFKSVVEEKFMDYVPVEHRKKLYIHPVCKINRIVTALNLVPASDESAEVANISPMIYLEDMYERYCGNGDLVNCLSSAAEALVSAKVPFTMDELNFHFSEMNFHDNIIVQVLNTAKNKELLKTCPHRDFLDLSVIYRWVVSINDEGISSAIVNNKMMENCNLSEDQMYELAIKNTARLLPPIVQSMNDIAVKMMIADDTPEETIEAMMQTPEQLYVITNKKGINGAYAIIFEQLLYDLASKLQDDLIILPSSNHEILAVPASTGSLEQYSAMVSEVNNNTVDLSERLSEHAYYYSRERRRVEYSR